MNSWIRPEWDCWEPRRLLRAGPADCGRRRFLAEDEREEDAVLWYGLPGERDLVGRPPFRGPDAAAAAASAASRCSRRALWIASAVALLGVYPRGSWPDGDAVRVACDGDCGGRRIADDAELGRSAKDLPV